MKKCRREMQESVCIQGKLSVCTVTLVDLKHILCKDSEAREPDRATAGCMTVCLPRHSAAETGLPRRSVAETGATRLKSKKRNKIIENKKMPGENKNHLSEISLCLVHSLLFLPRMFSVVPGVGRSALPEKPEDSPQIPARSVFPAEKATRQGRQTPIPDSSKGW